MNHPGRAEQPAGLAYLVEHGHAADGSHGQNAVPTQHLVNPRAQNPTSDPAVREWIRRRVAADPSMKSAADAQE